jgi:small subunit ribosomal protein S20
MANHKSAIKRIRANNTKRLHNRYYAKTARNAVKTLRNTTDKKEASALLPKVVAMLDKLAKKNVIHKNKASNLKSKLTKKVNAIAK